MEWLNVLNKILGRVWDKYVYWKEGYNLGYKTKTQNTDIFWNCLYEWLFEKALMPWIILTSNCKLQALSGAKKQNLNYKYALPFNVDIQEGISENMLNVEGVKTNIIYMI